MGGQSQAHEKTNGQNLEYVHEAVLQTRGDDEFYVKNRRQNQSAYPKTRARIRGKSAKLSWSKDDEEVEVIFFTNSKLNI